jgi:predicted DNA-binding protein YlxM (UPF0122 family)
MTPVLTKILTTILKLTSKDSVSVTEISEKVNMSTETVHDLILKMKEKKIFVFEEGKIEISLDQRMRLAMEILKMGADFEKVCKCLSWNEFEEITALILRENDYSALRNFNFKVSGKRWQIDVLGFQKPNIFSIDCKHWRRSWKKTAIEKAIDAQIKRSKALGILLPNLKDRLRIQSWNKIKIIPIILTLSLTPFKIYKGVPTVPIFHFQNFLLEIHVNINSFKKIDVTFPSSK